MWGVRRTISQSVPDESVGRATDLDVGTRIFEVTPAQSGGVEVSDRRAQAQAPASGIDKNASERALRAAALGRKNYFFAGSDAGER